MDKNFQIVASHYSFSFSHDNSDSLLDDITSGIWDINCDINSDGYWYLEISLGKQILKI